MGTAVFTYLNQKAVWGKVVGKNAFAEPSTVDKEIDVRWEWTRRLIRDTHGREVVSEGRVFCLEKVNPGDFLTYEGKKYPVLAVSGIVDVNGKEEHREVAV